MSRSRLSGSVCEDIALEARFLKNGVPSDPAAICSIKIYKCSVVEENLITEIIFPEPVDSDFDLSNEFIYDGAIQRCGNTAEAALCGTDTEDLFTAGCYILNLNLCPELFGSGVYFDVWNFVGTNCESSCSGTDGSDITSSSLCDNEDLIQSQCNKFFVNDGGWYVDDGLKNIKLGFEPLDKRFQQPEVRLLEVGLTPLPLYDFNTEKFNGIIQNVDASITIMTANCETLVDSESMKIGLRQGSYRSNPYVLQYLLDTNRFLKGTYKYRVDIKLPDGQTRSSPYFTVAIR